MSKWVENFESHQFHIDLENYKDELDSFNTKDISDLAILDEIARLKKIISFINSFLKMIDPELNRFDCLSSANTHLKNSVKSFNQFKSNMAVAQISNVNAHIDNCITAINALNIKAVKLNNKSVSSMLSAYQVTISDSFEKIDLESTTQASEKIKVLEKELLEDEEEHDSIKTRINNLLENIETRSNEVDVFYDNTFVDVKEDEISTKTLITNSKKHVLEEVKLLNSKLIEANVELKELEKFHIKIFGKLDEKEEVRLGGLQKELDDRVIQLDELEKNQSKTYEAGLKEIKNLLPNATSVGLAKSYKLQRSKFSGPIKIWNSVFILSILTMFGITVLSFFDVKYSDMGWEMIFQETTDYKETLNNFFFRIPLLAPLIWLAIYGGRRRSEALRLEQEYAHKETLAMSYSSYKKQIDELQLQDTTLAEKLIDSSISTIAHNASESLNKKNHKESTPIGESLEGVTKLFETLKDTIKSKG